MKAKVIIDSDGTGVLWYKTGDIFDVEEVNRDIFRIIGNSGHAGKPIPSAHCAVLLTCVEGFSYVQRNVQKGDEFWSYFDTFNRVWVLQRDGEMRHELTDEVVKMQFKRV